MAKPSYLLRVTHKNGRYEVRDYSGLKKAVKALDHFHNEGGHGYIERIALNNTTVVYRSGEKHVAGE